MQNSADIKGLLELVGGWKTRLRVITWVNLGRSRARIFVAEEAFLADLIRHISWLGISRAGLKKNVIQSVSNSGLLEFLENKLRLGSTVRNDLLVHIGPFPMNFVEKVINPSNFFPPTSCLIGELYFHTPTTVIDLSNMFTHVTV
ncbi:hypothetical protein L484_001978 [Morus notabilis]|uniref:Uncharacterized protein n=1 Tax=Morus notabilis TaxID=981085 RepID=W9R684_9ROSA|nr:hypothetical protein L484_001978 [Morus notabilis]